MLETTAEILPTLRSILPLEYQLRTLAVVTRPVGLIAVGVINAGPEGGDSAVDETRDPIC